MPRSGHHKKAKINLIMKLRSDDINYDEIKHKFKKLIKQFKDFLSRKLHRNEISQRNYKLENSKLKNLETRFESLISKAKRLEKDKNLYQNENSKLTEENLTLQNIVNTYEAELERYSNTIKKTYTILQNFVDSNEIDLTQLTELFNEIREMCEGEEGEVVASGSSISNNDDIVFNSFNDAANASEPRIVELENDGVPGLYRTHRFYVKEEDVDKGLIDLEFRSF